MIPQSSSGKPESGVMLNGLPRRKASKSCNNWQWVVHDSLRKLDTLQKEKETEPPSMIQKQNTHQAKDNTGACLLNINFMKNHH